MQDNFIIICKSADAVPLETKKNALVFLILLCTVNLLNVSYDL